MRTIMLALVAATLLALVGAKSGEPLWLNATWNTTAQGEVVTAGDFVAFSTSQAFDMMAESVNATTGSTVWSAQLPFDQSSFAPLVFVCDAVPQFLFMVSSGTFDGAYSALNRSNGVTLWTLPVTVPFTSDAAWICPPTAKDPLLIITESIVYSVDPVRGKLLYEHYANTTNTGLQVYLVNRCGPQETSTCFVYLDVNLVIHVVDVRTGNVLSRIQLPLNGWGRYVAGSSADVFFLVAQGDTTAMRWNGTRVWAGPGAYAAGDADVWVSLGVTPNTNLTAFSAKTGEQLWTWPSAQEKINTTSSGVAVTFTGDLPLVSSFCYQGVSCNTAAFDPRTGTIKWIVYNQSLTTPRFACPSYALFSNETVATLVRIQDGETRYVHIPPDRRAWAVAQTTSTILVQSSILASYPRF